ncbi:hypothetical protein HDU76_002633 [Blyttiomyces sp. JEL0837]|nr:hypothetical protein HDU76_002633 [Blyttiomyces sp. JEL0837]
MPLFELYGKRVFDGILLRGSKLTLSASNHDSGVGAPSAPLMTSLDAREIKSVAHLFMGTYTVKYLRRFFWSSWFSAEVTLFASRERKWAIFDIGEKSILIELNDRVSIKQVVTGDRRYYFAIIEVKGTSMWWKRREVVKVKIEFISETIAGAFIRAWNGENIARIAIIVAFGCLDQFSYAIASSKLKTNITVAVYLPYVITDPSSAAVFSVMDAAAELAIDLVNNDPNVLSDTFVNIKKFNSWDPEIPENLFDLLNSGGYAVSASINVSESGVVAVMGDFSGTSTSFSAQIFSQYEIPFCGPTQGGVLFSDKNKYKYLFRMMGGVGYGNYLLQLLRALKVKRVAIVTAFDPVSQGLAQDTQRTLTEGKINILTKLVIRRDAYLQKNYDPLFNTLKHVDARYIIIFAGPYVTMDFFFKAGDAGLVDEHHAFIGYNPPVPAHGDFENPAFTEPANKYFSGYLTIVPDMPDEPAYPMQRFMEAWAQHKSMYPQKYPELNPATIFFAINSYDCTSLILAGLDKLLKDNPNYTPEMLANRQLQSLLTPDKFANTGNVTYYRFRESLN